MKIILVHGHQGTLDSDKMAGVSKFLVRHVWRNVQRLFNLRSTSPATDTSLRDAHDLAMYTWAEEKGNVILIAGHTHKPVFASTNHVGRLARELRDCQAQLKTLPSEKVPTSGLVEQIAAKRAQLEFVRAKGEGKGLEGKRPCYFNTGCCSFSDGNVTGLEICDGEIRLVRWPDAQGSPTAKVIESRKLAEVFEELLVPKKEVIST